MSVHDLYAVSAENLEAAKVLLSTVLNLEFVGHDSGFFGEYDLAELPEGRGTLRLQSNCDPLFEEDTDPPKERFMEPQFPDYALLLYVDVEELTQAEQLRETLLSHSPLITLLSHEPLSR